MVKLGLQHSELNFSSAQRFALAKRFQLIEIQNLNGLALTADNTLFPEVTDRLRN